MIKIYSVDDDNVIDSKFLTGMTNYEYAINSLYPLVNKLPIQRRLQNPSFYKRLRQDLVDGCIMPPITLAFISDKEVLPKSEKDAQAYINEKINEGFILDGIQRINALFKAYNEPELLGGALDLTRPIFVNIIICKSMDNLLYRMITLNNGQKPMTANHQIEILLGNLYKFNDLEIEIQTEKQKGKKKIINAFNKANIIKSYLAFLSSSTAIDNKKIIERKMDELIAMKIIESNITNDNLEYSDIISKVNELSESKVIKKWFDNANNIIGFSVGIRQSFEDFKNETTKGFEEALENLEVTIKDLNISTIKLSKERRNLSEYFIRNYNKLKHLSNLELLNVFNEEVL